MKTVPMAYVDVVEDERGAVVAELYTTHDKYVLPDGSEMFISTGVAYCRSCARFTLVERFVSPDELEASALRWNAKDRGALQPRADAFRDLHGATRAKVLADQLAQAVQWRRALRTRRSGPRCLECGGPDYQVIPADADGVRVRELPHGRVRVREAVCHASMVYAGRRYDTEGRRITKARQLWRRLTNVVKVVAGVQKPATAHRAD